MEENCTERQHQIIVHRGKWILEGYRNVDYLSYILTDTAVATTSN
jgi:hypothetical protein